jgi:superfamily II DNA or RNA helicase
MLANKMLPPQSGQLSPVLRDYQVAALDAVKSAYAAGTTRQLLTMATGTGKTCLFASLAGYFEGRVIFLAHREELVEQAAEKLRIWNGGEPVGIEKADRRADNARLVVASVQTIGRKGSKRLEEFNPDDFDALVIDEAHHAAAESYGRIIEHFAKNPSLLLLGVTATPSRGDGVALDGVFDAIVYRKDLLSAVRDGWLTPPRGIRVPTDTDISAVHTKAGDFDAGELAAEINTPARNELAVESWLLHCHGRQTVAFTIDVQHARDLAAAFVAREISAMAIWGNDPDRAKKLAAHRRGEITVLCNCALLTEGYDDWRIARILLARPTKSGALYQQIVGRGTRIPDGIGNLKQAIAAGIDVKKRDCVVLDLADNSGKHKLITLASLLGLGANADLSGMDLEQAANEITKIRKEYPSVDIERIKDLAAWAEEIDLFSGAECPPEIAPISKNIWLRSGTDRYSLSPSRACQLVVNIDLIGHWNVVMFLDGRRINYPCFSELDGAIRFADSLVPREYRNLLDRRAEWRSFAPSEKQLETCGKMRIRVPDGATKGQVSALISARIGSNPYWTQRI